VIMILLNDWDKNVGPLVGRSLVSAASSDGLKDLQPILLEPEEKLVRLAAALQRILQPELLKLKTAIILPSNINSVSNSAGSAIAPLSNSVAAPSSSTGIAAGANPNIVPNWDTSLSIAAIDQAYLQSNGFITSEASKPQTPVGLRNGLPMGVRMVYFNACSRILKIVNLAKVVSVDPVLHWPQSLVNAHSNSAGSSSNFFYGGSISGSGGNIAVAMQNLSAIVSDVKPRFPTAPSLLTGSKLMNVTFWYP